MSHGCSQLNVIQPSLLNRSFWVINSPFIARLARLTGRCGRFNHPSSLPKRPMTLSQGFSFLYGMPIAFPNGTFTIF